MNHIKWSDTEYTNYEVSESGLVRNKNTMCVLKHHLKHGYPQVHLYVNGKSKYCVVHRLVAKAFLPNPFNLPEVNHKDENRNNPIKDNLEWCTSSYNKLYSGHRKGKKVVCITTGTIYDSVQSAARLTKIPSSNICRCCNNERDTAGKLKWSYLKEGD